MEPQLNPQAKQGLDAMRAFYKDNKAALATIDAYMKTGTLTGDPSVTGMIRGVLGGAGMPIPTGDNAAVNLAAPAATSPTGPPPAGGPEGQTTYPTAGGNTSPPIPTMRSVYEPGGPPGSPPPPPTPPTPPAPPAPPQAPPTGGNPVQNPTGPLDPESLRGSLYLNNADAAMRQLFRSMGLDPDRLGLYGKQLVGTLQPLLQSRLSMAGLESGTNRSGAPLDTLEQVISQVGQAAQRPGFFGGMQDFAQSVMPNLGGYISGLSDVNQQQNAMTMAQTLGTAGMNPIMQQAIKDEAARAQGGFEDVTRQTLGTPDMPNNYWKWLQAQAPQQYNYLNRILFGGR